MKPAEVTSTRATFLLAQNTPTQAVMTAFRDHSFTYYDVHPDSSPIAGPSTFPGSISSPLHHSPPLPLSPSRNPFLLTHTSPASAPRSPPSHQFLKWRLDPAANPSLLTPSKQMRFLGNSLANTASASFLITKANTTHLQMSTLIKPPVLESTPSELRRPEWDVLRPAIPIHQMTREDLLEHSEKLTDEL
ncbi:hypothetical protein BT96DRAFT_1088156 [Gymnopus androsaceus JB14]|uniref:Uncharacterized protein n=1 Tax=Gymnopus androsaceus JB14 TaxID=1447944 RepID=A0A6A4HUQ7_9AGAR|nr:hypothetical protein BT96DRAFT_1088156 [Gymnopus androsaceus JB14]